MTKKSNKNVSRIQIPNSIIINKEIPHNSFGLYVTLKSISIYKDGKQSVKVYLNEIKKLTGWNDNRTIKKYMDNLYDMGFIDIKIDRLSVTSRLEFNLTSVCVKGGFTQIDRKTVTKIIRVTKTAQFPNRKKTTNLFAMALRLFYYYEKNYNAMYGVAFPSYEATRADTGISYAYIKYLNDLLSTEGLIKINTGKFNKRENMYGAESVRKEVNSYIPICNRDNKV